MDLRKYEEKPHKKKQFYVLLHGISLFLLTLAFSTGDGFSFFWIAMLSLIIPIIDLNYIIKYYKRPNKEALNTVIVCMVIFIVIVLLMLLTVDSNSHMYK